MDISPIGLACNWLPHLPSIVKTSMLAILGYSENTEHQDVLTEIIVAAARPILRTPAPLLQSQHAFKRDYGVFGRMWVAKYVVPSPEPAFEAGSVLGIRPAVDRAIKMLDSTQPFCEMSDLINVESEWTGYRRNASHLALRPDVSEEEMYHLMMEELEPDCPTLLYLHGGAHCLMDPATHRWTTSGLARDCQGRVLSVRYRLSPQSIFPAALLDALTAYLALLSPPAGAFHDPVSASKIVFAGDSSGAGLVTSLLLLLLTLGRNGVKIRFHGRDIAIPDPPCAGLAVTSAWLDVSRALPSTVKNTRWDIVAPPPLDAASPPFPPDEIWPTTPPRAETYCTAGLVSHPLVSPLAAKPDAWRGAPPVYLSLGWEVFQDEIEVFARRVFQSSSQAVVVFNGYEGMPHCFAMAPWNGNGRRASREWGAFCSIVTGKKGVQRQSMATWTSKHGAVTEVRIDELGMTNVGSGYDRKQPLDDPTVERMMAQSRSWRMELEEEMVNEWKRSSIPISTS